MGQNTPIFTNGQLPPGRLVWGDLYKPNDTDYKTKQPRKDKQGNLKSTYDFGVAFAKTPGIQHFAQEPWAAAIWAEGHRGNAQAGQNPHFAWKITDGDSAVPNRQGNKPCEKEGYPGHWVLSFSSQFAPQLLVTEPGSHQPRYWRGPGQPVGVSPDDPIIPGHYVTVQGTVSYNNDPQSPGVFLNHNSVCRIGFGPAIVGGPNPMDAHTVPTALPAGASVTPVGPAAVLPPAATPVPAAPVATPPVPPAAPTVVAPVPGFTAPPPAAVAPPPVPPVPPAAPPAAVARVMTPKAGGVSYEAFRAQNWTDQQLIEQGYMLP